ncbi:hypothetical protein C8J56DRAFT_884197 [Mycena floridula]|nr:hypothetical protein C8J56DRAFT_884197 [Mycena floridula]
MSNPELPFDASSLPLASLESLRFKANQIIESINTLMRTIDGHPNGMPAWPDVLSKYNILLSQTHNFSTSLVNPIQTAAVRSNGFGAPSGNPFETTALHPCIGMTDTQLDNDVIPLLRNQQTMEVLKVENDTVRRLSEHMATRGSIGVLSGAVPSGRKPEYEDVLRECTEIREAHDHRVERAVRAVTMLRDRFDWKQRVEVQVEEPEELTWDPRLGIADDAVEDEDADMDSGDDGSSDEEEVQDHLEGVTPTNQQFSMGAPEVADS